MTRDMVISALVLFRLLTVEWAWRLLAPELTRGAVEKMLREMAEVGTIRAVTFGCNKYYVLSGATCRKLGLPTKRSRAFSAQGFITNIAILMFCVKTGFTRFTRRDIEERAPHLIVPGVSAERYLKAPDNRLLLAVVDHGCSLRNFARKIRREWEKRRENYEWMLLQDHRQTEVVAILAHEQKARRLKAMIDFDITTEVLPALQKFVMRKDS